MAVAAIDAETAHMMIMAEWHGLSACDVLLGDVRRAVDCSNQPKKADHQKKRAEYTQSRKGVGAAVKNLRHSCCILTANSTIPGLELQGDFANRLFFTTDEAGTSPLSRWRDRYGSLLLIARHSRRQYPRL